MSPRLHILVPIFIIFTSNFLICSESAAVIDDKLASLSNNDNSEFINKNSEILTRNTRQAIKSDYPVVIYNGRLYVPENWQLMFRYGFKFFVKFLKNAVEYYRSQEPVEYEDEEDVNPRDLSEDDSVVDTTLLPRDDNEIETTTLAE